MRGKQPVPRTELCVVRITPAHAGKTNHWGFSNAAKQDHPRACGENYPVQRVSLRATGSPPRMRGKQVVDPHLAPRARITPAHAGKTLAEPVGHQLREDHPRACGENRPILRLPALFSGSPPRMRGKPRKMLHREGAARITPAHAGKTFVRRQRASREWDHPRACGENRARALCRTTAGGSPPRMRGKLKKLYRQLMKERITPAHAGKTSCVAYAW